MLLGKRLKELRLTHGLTQKQVGDLINVTKVSICCYERGTRIPTLENLIDLANVFETDINYFLGNDIRLNDPETSCVITLAHDEINLIKELRKHTELYEKLIDDPKRMLEFVEKKVR